MLHGLCYMPPAPSFTLPTRLAMQTRRAVVEKSKIDPKARTAEFSFSSEAPVLREYGVEILSHQPSAVDLSRFLEGAAPVLDNHVQTEQIGIVERAWLSGRKGHASVRFSSNPKAQEVFRDVQDGIKRNISVGYLILEGARVKEGRSMREPD